MAQTYTTSFTTLHSFDGSRDGGDPQCALILSGDNLYGTTSNGGSSNNGTIFAINTNGTSFRVLHDFTGGIDGGAPQAGLLLSGRTLYGTASSGGAGGSGTVFAVDTNGSQFTVLHAFTRISGAAGPHLLIYSNSDGAYPCASLVSFSNTLYGTATRGGRMGQGTLFALNTNGSGFTNLHNFTDGINPLGLILEGNILFGTTQGSGPPPTTDTYYASVFAVDTNGLNFTTLHSFPGRDVFRADAPLLLVSSTLFGATFNEDLVSADQGTVFKLRTDGTDFANLHTFTAVAAVNQFINADGAFPWSGVIELKGNLYGTTLFGGVYRNGTIFTLKPDGSNFSLVYSFSFPVGMALTNADGSGPQGLIASGNTLYGTAQQGGTTGNGTIFSLAILPVTSPVIVAQPLSRTNVVGSTAQFSVGASATGPLNYQWLKGSTALLQRTNSSLVLTNVSPADAASYSVIVSNVAGSVTSAAAVLTVIDRPQLKVLPSSTNVVLTWPGSASLFTLQFTTNLASPIKWTTVSAHSVVSNTTYALTNPLSGPQRFFRLSQ